MKAISPITSATIRERQQDRMPRAPRQAPHTPDPKAPAMLAQASARVEKRERRNSSEVLEAAESPEAEAAYIIQRALASNMRFVRMLQGRSQRTVSMVLAILPELARLLPQQEESAPQSKTG